MTIGSKAAYPSHPWSRYALISIMRRDSFPLLSSGAALEWSSDGSAGVSGTGPLETRVDPLAHDTPLGGRLQVELALPRVVNPPAVAGYA
jgi:hypothetical protein